MHDNWSSDSDNEADYDVNGSVSGESQIDSEIEVALYGQIHHLSDLQNPDVSVLSLNSNEILDNTIESNKLDSINHSTIVSNKSDIHCSTTNYSDIEIISEVKGPEKIIIIDEDTRDKKSKTRKNKSISKSTQICKERGKKRKVKSAGIKPLSTDIISLSSSDDDWLVVDNLSDHSSEDISINVSDAFLKFLQTDSKNTAAENWVIDLKDKYKTNQSRYYKDSNVQCRNCKGTGHLEHKCPIPKKLICYFCGKGGHTYSTCKKKVCSVCGSEHHPKKHCQFYTNRKCNRCGIAGHQLELCPDIWRQYHLTTKVGPIVHGSLERKKVKGCYNCAKKGHYGHLCPKKRMWNYISANTPFIIAYDDILLKRIKGLISKSIPDKRKTKISDLSAPQNSKISSSSDFTSNEMIHSKKKSPKQRKHIIFEDTDHQSAKALIKHSADELASSAAASSFLRVIKDSSRQNVSQNKKLLIHSKKQYPKQRKHIIYEDTDYQSAKEVLKPSAEEMTSSADASSLQQVNKDGSRQNISQNKKLIKKLDKKYDGKFLHSNDNSFKRQTVHFNDSNQISKHKKRKKSKEIQFYNPYNELFSKTVTLDKLDSDIQVVGNIKKSKINTRKLNKRKKKPLFTSKKINARGFQLSIDSAQKLCFS